MSHERNIKHVKRVVKMANTAQTAKDYIDAVTGLDIDLPWRKRSDPEPENENMEAEIEPPSSSGITKKHLFIGGAVGSVLLFLLRGRDEKASVVDTSMQLTPSFKLSEFLVSSSVPEIKKYALNQSEMRNVIRVATVLQQIRDSYGKPIIITSGGRPVSVRTKDGKTMLQVLTEKGYAPSSHSQHMDFSAADWTVENKNDLPYLFQKIVNAARLTNLITQVILYIENGVPNFIHLGVMSNMKDFKISPESRFLLAEIRKSENGRSTVFHSFTEEKMRNLMV